MAIWRSLAMCISRSTSVMDISAGSSSIVSLFGPNSLLSSPCVPSICLCLPLSALSALSVVYLPAGLPRAPARGAVPLRMSSVDASSTVKKGRRTACPPACLRLTRGFYILVEAGQQDPGPGSWQIFATSNSSSVFVV
jgi:hypothetical protein